MTDERNFPFGMLHNVPIPCLHYGYSGQVHVS